MEGSTWEHYNEIITPGLNSIIFVDQNYGWCVGASTILYTDNGGIVGTESSISIKSNSQIKTHPNPFTNSATIEYELKQPSTVQLSVYNQLGQLGLSAIRGTAAG